MKDKVQEQITHYENKFNDLVNEIDKDSILENYYQGLHTAGLLTKMNEQINLWLDRIKLPCPLSSA